MEESHVSTHIRVLGILQIVYASLGLLLALGLLVLFGGIATLVGMNAGGDDSVVAVPIIAMAGTFAAAFFVVLSLPRLIAGIGLLKHRSWARVLTIVVSAIGLFDVPFGLALGIYGLWVTLNREGAAILESQATHTA